MCASWNTPSAARCCSAIPTVSILRRPGFKNVATWGAVMRSLGYQTSFLYGGYGSFDNMNAFFGGNGFEVQDRRSIDKVRFENIWGVADEDLFDHSLAYFDRLHATGKPFFSIIMTTSNHKPFTFRKGLEDHGIPPEGGIEAARFEHDLAALAGGFQTQPGHLALGREARLPGLGFEAARHVAVLGVPRFGLQPLVLVAHRERASSLGGLNRTICYAPSY